MVEVIWTKKATSQLESAVRYLKKERGSFYAELVLDKLLATTRNLDKFPKMGSIEPFLDHKKSEYRFLVAWSYKIIYRVTKQKVVISRVFHTSQDPNKLKKL